MSINNRYGYGFHPVGTETCPNCGHETERHTEINRHAGIHMARCYRCAPVWAGVLVSLGFIVSVIGLMVLLLGAIGGVFWPGLCVSAAGLLTNVFARHYPRRR